MAESYGDLAIPEIKLIQNVGGDEAKDAGAQAGDFFCALTGEVFKGNDGFQIVVTGRSKVERTYWGADHEVQSDEPPTCSSTDGVTSINGDVCKTACPYQAFTDAPGLLTAEERKGKCTPGYRVMGISLTNMMPVFIRCSGISATAARELNTLLAFHKNIRGQYFKAMFNVISIKVKTGSGEAYKIKFGEPLLLNDDTQTEIKELMQAVGIIATETTQLQKQIETGTQKQIEQKIEPQNQPPAHPTDAQAKDNLQACKEVAERTKPTMPQTTQAVQPIKTPQDEPGTVILGKTEKSNVNVPPAVQKAAEEVKRKLPEMNF
jgi:hypothetical protein